MDPGRELDALVAEKVKGWRLVEVEMWKEADPSVCPWHLDDGWAWEGRAGDDYAHTWSPSSKIAQAWGVLEELEARGFVVRYQTMGPKRIGRRVTIERPEEPGVIYGTAEAPEAAHAICLAALEAVSE